MSILSLECFNKVLSLRRITFRIPWSSYQTAISSCTSLFDICRAVEPIATDNRLVHAHLAGFLCNQSRFLVETCYTDNIRISLLNLSKLSREISILICKGFISHYIQPHLLKQVCINLMFTYHLVIIVGIQNGNLLKSELLMCLFYGNRNAKLTRNCVTENEIAEISNSRCSCTGTKSDYARLLCNRACSKHFPGSHWALYCQNLIFFDCLLHSINGFCLIKLGIISNQINLILSIWILINFINGQIHTILHCLTIGSAWAGISGNKPKFNSVA